ncbi:39S ribosomal protein L44, mitochondrial [Dermatophagoides pteronyssinus]|nr:39S ribosomal protein L44, mitochondrial [Dermatophagoides pteronyssinus]
MILPSKCSSKTTMFNQQNSLNQMIQKRGMKLANEKLLRKMYWRKRSFDAKPERLRARSEWQDWDFGSELYAFAQRLQEPQLNNDILIRLFTHRSYVNEQKSKQESLGVQNVSHQLEDNSEFIQSGSIFMRKFLSKYLRYHLRQAPEECIQSLVDYLMSKTVMQDISKWIGCTDLVLCSEFPPNEQTLADTVSSIVGALIQTNGGGEKRAQNFIIDFICTYLNGRDPLEIWRIDQMDLNLEIFLQNQNPNLKCESRILRQSAIDTIESCFIVGIYSNDDDNPKLLGQSSGESLSIAKRMAELDAFRRIFGLTISNIRFEFGKRAYDLEYDKYDRENFHLFQSSSPKQEEKLRQISS